MDLLHVQEVASVALFDLRLSEDEMEAFATALSHALQTLDDEDLHKVFADDLADLGTPAETREFAQGTYDEVVALLRQYCRPEFLPTRFRPKQEE